MSDKTDKFRVLYVEDEPLPRWTGGKLLESFGAHVLTAESCAQAEELWHDNELDFVVCDYRLEDGLSIELVARMRKAGHSEPVVCLTGEAEELSVELQKRLDLRAVLKKPLDAESLSAIMAGARSVTQSVKPVAEAVSKAAFSPYPVWVSPIWGMRSFVGNLGTDRHLLVMPGVEGDVWVVGFGCADACKHDEAVIAAITQALKDIAGILQGAAHATELLAHARIALARGIDPEHDWNFEVLHLQVLGISTAAGGQVGLRLWAAPDAGAWRLLEWNQADDSMQQARRVIVTSSEKDQPDAHWAALRAGHNEQIGGRLPVEQAAFAFWTRAPSRLIEWEETDGLGVALSDSLDCLEKALELDGVAPDIARQTACGMLDLVEWGGAGRLAISWQQGAGVEISLVGAQPPLSEFVRFFTSVKAGTEGSILTIVPNGVPRIESAVQRPLRLWQGPTSDRVGRFRVVALPRLVTEAEATAIAQSNDSEMWLALDCARARHVSSRALAVWAALAAGRRGTGRFCLTNFSGRMGRLFRRLGLQQEMELIASLEELDAAGRRLTTSCERASLLESIVGGGNTA